ncbi:MAG: Steroid 3-ketoacyl-CoA thiolase [Acidimicrobiales bacterium]|nr:MAG: thiolase family protein [Actinomycetota bacterium]MBV6507724.1 Steroid 3-ketoacyl-CoA thiolase [Acidimicrobiales bacterium]RIK07648.1 MAG: steroid 3-ketoacyl-CoA thiolase [Acidobacteriota bacterium]
METREAVIVDTVRTPIGKRKGALSTWQPSDLLAHTVLELMHRTGVDAERIDDVVGGCVTQVGEQGCNVTRNAWVAAGLPQSVPATTVDRQCGSSQQAVHFVAQGVMAGAYDIAIACGVESMTRAPMASNASGGMGPFSSDFLTACDGKLLTQFEVAQILADRYGITREEMDSYSVQSHARAAENTANGHFAREIVPVPLKDEEGRLTGEVLESDEGIRPGSNVEDLAKLESAAGWDPTIAPDITAGNSSQMSDGAAAMLIADRAVAEQLGLPVRARFAHFTVAGDDAVLVLSAPNPATRKLLARSGLSIDDFDAMECNEAFAAIALMWATEFKPDPEKFNPRGGAIAIGHPLGASGVRIMTTLLNHLEVTGGRLGFQTMCEGGGQANATVIERLG